MSQAHLGLFDTPPTRGQARFGLAVIGLLLLTALPVMLVAAHPWPEVDIAYPLADAIMCVGELITATLLYAQASVFRLRALAILGTCYLITGLLVIPHALTFPGAFSPNGLLGAGVSTTGFIALARRIAFAVGVMLYVQAKPADLRPPEDRPAPRIGLQVFAAIFLTVAVTVLASGRFDLLPPLFLDRARVVRSNFVAYELGSITLWVVAMVMLFRRRSSVLDMWLLVALGAWLIVTLVNATLPARFTVGFYYVVAFVVVSHLIVMLALLAEFTRLYGRLALSVSAWNREHEARLTSMDTLAAAISHEIGQPLTAIGLNANAGLAWLSGNRPNVERAITSMRAAIEARNLAFAILKSVRMTFARRTGLRTAFYLSDLVRETLPLVRRHLVREDISLELALDEAPFPVVADRTQLQEVLVNLLTNAIQSLSTVEDRPRRISVRSAQRNGHTVVLEVSDNGAGIPHGDLARIFDPFFTTKPSGTGLGLSLCRIIVEAHGGRLLARHGEDLGATFQLELPRSASHALSPADCLVDAAA